MQRSGLRFRQASWILYDVASSGYVLLITAVAFPLYFKLHVLANAPWSEAIWGALIAISSIVAGLLSPLVGAAADRSNSRLRFLACFTAACSLSTVMLALPASAAVIATTFCISLVAYLVAASLYDALMKNVAVGASAADLSSLSALGWGLGYVGGLVCFGLSKSMMNSDVTTDPAGFALTFPVVGVYFAIVAGISVIGQWSPSGTSSLPLSPQVWTESWRQVRTTLNLWRHGGHVPRLIVGAHLSTGAVSTLALFTPIMLASNFGLPVERVAVLSAIFSILSIPSTLLAGWLARRMDPLVLLFSLLPVWITLMMFLVTGSGWWEGLAVAICLGLAIGPTNALARSLVATVIDESHAAEMFGFAAFFNRLTAAIGPLMFGFISSATGIYWPAILIAGAVLVAGFAIIPRQTHPERGQPIL